MHVLKKVLNLQWVIVIIFFVLLDTFYPTVNQGIVRHLNVNRDNVYCKNVNAGFTASVYDTMDALSRLFVIRVFPLGLRCWGLFRIFYPSFLRNLDCFWDLREL